MLNLCKYFGNYFGISSFRFTFAKDFKYNERQNYQKSHGYVFETRFQECNYG